MGYVHEVVDDHEGYVALMFADGERSSGTTGTGVLVWPGDDIKREEIRPYADVVAWQVRCDGPPGAPCHWTGEWHPLDEERPEHVDQRWMEPTEERERGLILEWREHVDALAAIRRVSDLARQVAALQRDLDTAVRACRAGGASWLDVGRALGLTQRAAEERYGTWP